VRKSRISTLTTRISAGSDTEARPV
jgi:hypothetical protein